MPVRPVRPMTADDLRKITKPTAVLGGTTEGYHFTYYDTATAVSGGQTELSFWDQARTGQLTNLETPGKLVSPKFFRIDCINITPLVVPTGAADPQQWDDLAQFLLQGNGQVVLSIQDKQYGPWPILEACALGGVTGFGVDFADATAESILYANSGVPGGCGIDIDGSLWLTPEAGFFGRLRWDSAPTPSVDTAIQWSMRGAVYRAVT